MREIANDPQTFFVNTEEPDFRTRADSTRPLSLRRHTPKIDRLVERIATE